MPAVTVNKGWITLGQPPLTVVNPSKILVYLFVDFTQPQPSAVGEPCHRDTGPINIAWNLLPDPNPPPNGYSAAQVWVRTDIDTSVEIFTR